jgi:hypothetical protein
MEIRLSAAIGGRCTTPAAAAGSLNVLNPIPASDGWAFALLVSPPYDGPA